MKAIQGTPRIALLGFFSSHILATLLIDVQGILPSALIPKPLADLLDFYVTTFQDPLMSNVKNLPWFQSLISLEMIFQLPFFFWAVAELSSTSSSSSPKTLYYYSDSFRCACIAYGAHASTSMAPILTAILSSTTNSWNEKMSLLGMYGPYLIFPLGLLCTAVFDNDNAASSASSTKTKTQ